jgi:hypothetical protein
MFVVLYANGAPRPMKMGTIASPWHYEETRDTALSYPVPSPTLAGLLRERARARLQSHRRHLGDRHALLDTRAIRLAEGMWKRGVHLCISAVLRLSG